MDSREAAKHSSKDDDGLFQKLQPNRRPESATTAGKEEALKLEPQPQSNGKVSPHEPSKGEPEAKATTISEVKGVGEPGQLDKETGTGEEDTQAQAKRELDGIFKASPGMFTAKE